MVKPPSPNGPTGGNGGVARRDCSHVQVVICVAGGTPNFTQFDFYNEDSEAASCSPRPDCPRPHAFIVDSEVVKLEHSDAGASSPQGWTRSTHTRIYYLKMSGLGERRRYHSFGSANAFSKLIHRERIPPKRQIFLPDSGGGVCV